MMTELSARAPDGAVGNGERGAWWLVKVAGAHHAQRSLAHHEEAPVGSTPQDIDATAAVARAKAEAAAIIGRAEVEAAATRARADADGEAIVARARVEAEEARALVHDERQRAAEIIEEARRHAAALRAEAEEVRRSADGTLERLLAARRELQATIDQLATSPNTLVDLTADLSDLDDLDDLVDVGRVVPLGATPAPDAEEDEATAGDERSRKPDGAVDAMVRDAIGRAARAATDAPAWTGDPAGQREALRANRRDLG
jgi:hypothetical protein